jgi:hypothetical protein
MTISHSNAVERIARVLAGQRLSANAHGDSRSASTAIDAAWPDYQGDAVAVLRTLREPDAAMAAAGDPDIWQAMVRAALGDHAATAFAAAPADDPLPVGSDPFIEGP